MTLSLDKPKLDNLAGEIWKSAERLRGKFKAYEYQNVVLPIIVIRRLECMLLKWREEKKAEIGARQPRRTEAELDRLVKNLEFNAQAKTPAQPVVTETKIKNTCLVLPPTPEPVAVCQLIESRNREFDRLSANLQAQITTLLAYRKSLIHECGTGQKRVTEAYVARVQRGQITGAASP